MYMYIYIYLYVSVRLFICFYYNGRVVRAEEPSVSLNYEGFPRTPSFYSRLWCSFRPWRLEDGHVPTFWLLLYAIPCYTIVIP